MTTKRSKKPARAARIDAGVPEVEALLASLAHPHKDAILRLRTLVRGADPRIVEEVKWNAPSFALGEHFATFHLRAKRGVMLVMHFGAKKRASVPKRATIADPTGMLTWLADDRATITFTDLADVEATREPFVAVVRSWIDALGATR